MKASFINGVVARNAIKSIVEFGCGDGNQLTLAQYPRYIGLDISRNAIIRCKDLFAEDQSKSFFLYDCACFADRAGLFQCDAALSLDVIYHLVEDPIYELYMRHLFDSARKFVVIFSTDTVAGDTAPHVRHRRYSDWVRENQPAWHVVEEMKNTSSMEVAAEFRVYARESSMSVGLGNADVSGRPS